MTSIELAIKTIEDLKAENKMLQARLDEILNYAPKIGESSYAKVVEENKILKDCVEYYMYETTDIIAVRAKQALEKIKWVRL